MSFLKKLVAMCGMAMGAGGVIASFLFYRASSTMLKLSPADDHPPYVLVAVMAALGLAVIVVAYDFGFHRSDPVTGEPPEYRK